MDMTGTEIKTLQRMSINSETNGIRKRRGLALVADQARLPDPVTSDLERNSAALRRAATIARRMVNPQRLAVVPWAARCIGCHEALERETPETAPGGSFRAA